jgi:hypothetical protein
MTRVYLEYRTHIERRDVHSFFGWLPIYIKPTRAVCLIYVLCMIIWIIYLLYSVGIQNA